ncbi:MAG: ABC transporter substrate-binding protein [Mycobacteriaceae bacterium]|uniref:ABC transporter substrate-binding protein n=1 Tax=Corynebacterium sp. TaxID=1720 RepID=UPI003F9EA98E
MNLTAVHLSSRRRPRRGATVLALATSAALVLAACSSGDDGDTRGSTGSGAGEGASEDGNRTVTDSEGNDVEVSADPEKVVTLHFAGIQALLDLGMAPAGQGTPADESLLTEEQYDQVKDAPVVSGEDGVNVEAIAEIEPDLVLVPNMIEPEVVDQIRDVAPAYIYTHGGPERSNWSGRVGQIADAVNRTAEYEELQSDFEARQQEIADKHADTVGDVDVALVGAYTSGQMWAMGRGSMIGEIIAPMGVQFAESLEDVVQGEDGGETEVSTENVGTVLADADVILHDTTLDGGVSEEFEEVRDLNSFRETSAAQEDHVYPIGKGTVAGYTDGFQILDNLDAALTELAG